MRFFRPPFPRAWVLVLLAALAFTLWVDAHHLQRRERIATLSRGESVPDAASPTGYAGGIRERVLPDHPGRSYAWIAETQRMVAEGSWRVRQINNENVFYGRATYAAAPYHWWLAALARVFSGHSPGLAIETAALWADPVLHLLLVIAVTVFAARTYGSGPAALAALAAATLFPFAAGFLPGMPDDPALGMLLALGSLLPLLAGLRATAPAAAFGTAGCCGGLGLWLNPAAQVPLLLGLAGGALLVAWLRRPAGRDAAPSAPLPWRLWSLAGGGTVLVACLIEYFPAHLGGWELRAVHPLYGLAWLGGGELLARATARLGGGAAFSRPRAALILLPALLALLAVPGLMLFTGNPGFLAADPLALRLTRQSDGVLATNLVAWLKADGPTLAAWATLLPVLLLGAGLWLVTRRSLAPAARAPLALLLGAALPLLVLACLQLRAWALLDVVLLALLPPLAALPGPAGRGFSRPLRVALLAAVLLPGAFLLLPARSAPDNELTVDEALGLVERDLAHWLAQRRGPDDRPVVLAPPHLTTTLNYYGGLRGLGTLAWENQAGLRFAIRIAISTNRAETIVLLRQRGVTHLVLPSWDPFFEPYLRSASLQLGEMFYRGLDRWILPPWLRPVPYQLPALPGFERQHVRIFEVVEEQDEPVAASRLTEYFIAQAEWDNARASERTLRQYPADFGALVARARLWAALNDAANFTPVFEPLLQRLAAGGDRFLPWDRRVSLALVLARGNRLPLAGLQAQRCLAELTETRLRSLDTDSLYQWLALNRTLGLEIADPRLRALARELLPALVRARL